MTNILTIISIADIHFGALDPKYTYDNLKSQFIDRLRDIHFDILAICGDYFHAKYMSNNPNITYGLMLMDQLVTLCKQKNAALIIIGGTESHDNRQLSLFYHYLQDPMLNFHIQEDIGFINIKGLRILCIPEKYGIPEEEYNKVLYYSGAYDICLLHGTFKNSVYGAEIATLNSTHAPVFTLNHFCNCKGPILAGHIHIPGVFEEYMYYNGCPLRFRHGEEESKGFLVTLYDPVDRWHLTNLVEIESYKFITINIDNIINQDPKSIIEYIKNEKEYKGIDFIRIQYSSDNDNMNVVRSYYHNSPNVKLQQMGDTERKLAQINEQVSKESSENQYLFNPEISDYDKFVLYINHDKGFDYISVDELIKILEE